MLVGGSLAFAALAADVLHHGKLWQCDEPWRAYLHTHAVPAAVAVLSLVSALGNALVVAAVGVAVGALLMLRRRWRQLAVWALALLGSGVLCGWLKGMFQVPRPTSQALAVLSRIAYQITVPLAEPTAAANVW